MLWSIEPIRLHIYDSYVNHWISNGRLWMLMLWHTQNPTFAHLSESNEKKRYFLHRHILCMCTWPNIGSDIIFYVLGNTNLSSSRNNTSKQFMSRDLPHHPSTIQWSLKAKVVVIQCRLDWLPSTILLLLFIFPPCNLLLLIFHQSYSKLNYYYLPVWTSVSDTKFTAWLLWYAFSVWCVPSSIKSACGTW